MNRQIFFIFLFLITSCSSFDRAPNSEKKLFSCVERVTKVISRRFSLEEMAEFNRKFIAKHRLISAEDIVNITNDSVLSPLFADLDPKEKLVSKKILIVLKKKYPNHDSINILREYRRLFADSCHS